jgi:hypothetical protein
LAATCPLPEGIEAELFGQSMTASSEESRAKLAPGSSVRRNAVLIPSSDLEIACGVSDTIDVTHQFDGRVQAEGQIRVTGHQSL